MSFKADLFVGEQKFKVLNCRYELSQSIDHKNKPSARPKGGLIMVRVECEGDNFLFDWMASDTMVKSGHVVFYKRDNEMSKMREIVFTDAYCVNLAEDFSAKGSQPMIIDLVISAEKISLGGSSEHQNTWRKPK